VDIQSDVVSAHARAHSAQALEHLFFFALSVFPRCILPLRPSMPSSSDLSSKQSSTQSVQPGFLYQSFSFRLDEIVHEQLAVRLDIARSILSLGRLRSGEHFLLDRITQNSTLFAKQSLHGPGEQLVQQSWQGCLSPLPLFA
jgi:hypothetical protein